MFTHINHYCYCDYLIDVLVYGHLIHYLIVLYRLLWYTLYVHTMYKFFYYIFYTQIMFFIWFAQLIYFFHLYLANSLYSLRIFGSCRFRISGNCFFVFMNMHTWAYIIAIHLYKFTVYMWLYVYVCSLPLLTIRTTYTKIMSYLIFRLFVLVMTPTIRQPSLSGRCFCLCNYLVWVCRGIYCLMYIYIYLCTLLCIYP